MGRDNLTASQRYRAMAHNRGRTRPERALASGLWLRGFRYLTHDGYRSVSGVRLVGKPDIVFSRKRMVIFVDGCFWHGCPKCDKGPERSGKFWSDKINENRKRDREVTSSLEKDGWRVVRVAEHDVNNATRLEETIDQLSQLLVAPD